MMSAARPRSAAEMTARSAIGTVLRTTLLACLALAASAQIGKRVLIGRADFEDGASKEWSPNDPARWRVAKDRTGMVYELVSPGEPGRLKAPTSWSLWTGREVGSFELTGRLRSAADPTNSRRDLCVFFHFRDPAHFYYVHFSASSDEFHNIIGLVDGRDRVKINFEDAGRSAPRLTDTAWHRFKVTYSDWTGTIEAFLDDMEVPILTAHDRTIGRGLVGVGSFDDTGAFDDLKLWRLTE